MRDHISGKTSQMCVNMKDKHGRIQLNTLQLAFQMVGLTWLDDIFMQARKEHTFVETTCNG